MQTYKFKELHKDKFKEMFTWCKEKFGHNAIWRAQLNNPQNVARWYASDSYPKEMFGMPTDVGSATFIFKREEDAIIFALKWAEK